MTNSELMTKQNILKREIEGITDKLIGEVFTEKDYELFLSKFTELNEYKRLLSIANAETMVEWGTKKMTLGELINIRSAKVEEKTLLEYILQNPNISKAVEANQTILMKIFPRLQQVSDDIKQIQLILNRVNNGG